MNTIIEDLKHYLATTPKEQIEKDWESLKEWGKVGPSVYEFLEWKHPVCEGLKEEIEYYLDHAELKAKCNGISVAQDYFDDLTKTARHFAQWGAEHAREQMMKEAVEGEVCYGSEGAYIETDFLGEYNTSVYGNPGDKVKLIIVKED